MTSDILLMTSTIAPRSDTFLLKVIDPSDRLAQYETALRFYLELIDAGAIAEIVYADNSGYPLDSLQAIAAEVGYGDRVEFISYTATVDQNNSRYYLEIHLIDEAMTRSARLTAAPETVIWKITGRYLLRNAGAIIRSYPAQADLYINLRNHPYETLDFYFVGFRRGSYTQHIGRDFAEFAGTENGEDVLRRKVEAGFDGVTVVPRFRVTPRLNGIRGFDGSKYGGLSDTTKYYTRRWANTLVPRLWI